MTLISARLRVLPALIPLNGKDVEMQTTDAYIQWRVIDGEWQDLLSLAEVGDIGPATEFQSTSTYLQYRAAGSGDPWTDLVALADIAGPEGPEGPSVTDGDKGEITVSGTGTEWVVNNRREILRSTARTYYVRSDGSDSNTGLVNNAGGAFLTIAKAVQVVQDLDLGSQEVIIQLADGTWSENVNFAGTPPFANLNQNSAPIILRGNLADWDNVVLVGGIVASGGARVQVEGIKIDPAVEYPCLSARDHGSQIFFQSIDFAETVGTADHIDGVNGGYVECIGNYRITGGAYNHIHQTEGGQIRFGAYMCEVLGTMTFSGQFCGVAGGIMYAGGMFWDTSGATVTGRTYLVHYGGAIRLNVDTNSGFPGSTNGFEQTGGRKDRQPIFQAHRAGVDTTFAVGVTWVDVPFTTEGFDTGAIFDLANNRVVARGGGIVLHGQVGVSGMTAGDTFEVRIFKNGATEVATGRRVVPGALLEIVPVDYVDYAQPNDLYKLQVRVTGTAGSKTLNGTIPYTFFSGFML